MVSPTRPPANGFVKGARKIYNPLGFSKGYNFVLFFIFAGALFGFSLARLEYLDFHGIYCNPDSPAGTGAGPGECYYYLRGHYEVGMIIHLGTIIPAGLLACFQFVPVIRYKALIVHRINGYIVVILALLGIAGALMIARHAFGGGLATQTGVGLIAVVSVVALGLAYYNIKRLQIEQHRAWMLRAWFYARSSLLTSLRIASIITTRIIMIIAATIISAQKNYYVAYPCAQIDFINKDQSKTLNDYPECASYYSGDDPAKNVVVRASMTGGGEQVGVALGTSFGMALWLALAIHAIGVEIYLHLTPREFERLRQVSYQRQLEAGMRHPGSAGLTVDKLGDAEPWIVPTRSDAKDPAVRSGSESG